MNCKQQVFLVVAVTLLGSLSPVAAQWEKKPYTEWSEKEALKMLNDSPWGRTMVFSTPSTLFRGPTSGRQGAGGQATSANSDSSTHVNFRIRFLSAKPIRQAISRQMELKSKGEMSDALAAHLKSIVEGEFVEYIVVTVSCDSQQPGSNFQEAMGLLNTRGTAFLKNNTFLETKGGKRVFLEEYQQPRADGLGARFLFKRMLDGEPFLTPDSNSVRFYSELAGNYRLDRRFKVGEMMFEGKLEY